MKIEDITKEDFEAYERLRASGATNMLDWLTASEYLGWNYVDDKDKYVAIIENYSKLAEKWPEVRR